MYILNLSMQLLILISSPSLGTLLLFFSNKFQIESLQFGEGLEDASDCSEDNQGGICFIHYQDCMFFHQKIADVPGEASSYLSFSHFAPYKQLVV